MTAVVVALLPERQITAVPLAWLRHRMSSKPSPLKSPTPATAQIVPTDVTVVAVAERPERQITFWPVSKLRHRMSDFPSLLKSATPTTFQ